MKILVAGGGLGGLTAANALLKTGFQVEVFEKSHELREIGAGVGFGQTPRTCFANWACSKKCCGGAKR